MWKFIYQPDVEARCFLLMSKQVMTHKESRILSEKFKEVRSMFIVGVDLAKRSHEAIVIDDSGSIVKKAFNFKNDSA